MTSAAALLVALLLLLRSILLLNKKLRSDDDDFPGGTPFYAPRILAEINTASHWVLQDDPTYNEALTHRYAELLREDMKQLSALGGRRTFFWCLVFRLWYRILTTRAGFLAFGQRSEGLLVLMSATLQALSRTRQEKLGRLT